MCIECSVFTSFSTYPLDILSVSPRLFNTQWIYVMKHKFCVFWIIGKGGYQNGLPPREDRFNNYRE